MRYMYFGFDRNISKMYLESEDRGRRRKDVHLPTNSQLNIEFVMFFCRWKKPTKDSQQYTSLSICLSNFSAQMKEQLKCLLYKYVICFVKKNEREKCTTRNFPLIASKWLMRCEKCVSLFPKKKKQIHRVYDSPS